MMYSREHYYPPKGLDISYIKPPKLTQEEIGELLSGRADVPLSHFTVSILLVFTPPILMFFYPSIWMALSTLILNLHTFNRFAQLVHAADHNAMTSNKNLDSLVGRISGYFLGYTQEGHKEAHDSHHLFLNTKDDADYVWCDPEGKVQSLFRGWMRDFFFISAISRFKQYIPRKNINAINTKEINGLGYSSLFKLIIPVAFTQLLILFEYAMLPGFQFYFLLYLLPLLTIYPAFIRLRSTVEHSFSPNFCYPSEKDRRVIRSVKANPIERFIFAPLGIEYHYEHHVFPSMPYYNAPKLREILKAKGFEVPVFNGYFAFIIAKWRAEKVLLS